MQTYRVNGVLEASDPLIYSSGTINIPAAVNGSYTSSPINFPPYQNKNLWVKVQVTGDEFSTSALIVNTCPVLPVTLAGFDGQKTFRKCSFTEMENGYRAQQ